MARIREPKRIYTNYTEPKARGGLRHLHETARGGRPDADFPRGGPSVKASSGFKLEPEDYPLSGTEPQSSHFTVRTKFRMHEFSRSSRPTLGIRRSYS